MRDSAIGDNTLTLAVNYEYTPTLTDVNGYSTGGRAQAWLDEHLRVGGVAMSETTGVAHQKMLGAMCGCVPRTPPSLMPTMPKPKAGIWPHTVHGWWPDAGG